MPEKETAKLWQKLLQFGACVHQTPETQRALSVAGNLFPNSEHMVPIKVFPGDAGSLNTGAGMYVSDGGASAAVKSSRKHRFSLGRVGDESALSVPANNGLPSPPRKALGKASKAEEANYELIKTIPVAGSASQVRASHFLLSVFISPPSSTFSHSPSPPLPSSMYTSRPSFNFGCIQNLRFLRRNVHLSLTPTTTATLAMASTRARCGQRFCGFSWLH